MEDVIVSNNVLEYCIIIVLYYLGLTFLSFNGMYKHVFIHLFIIYLSIIISDFENTNLVIFLHNVAVIVKYGLQFRFPKIVNLRN